MSREYKREWYRTKHGLSHQESCDHCNDPIPEDRRIDAKYCSDVCGNRARNRRHYQNHPVEFKQKRRKDNARFRRRILSRIKSRAKRQNISFDLTLEDIDVPEVCPVLGLPLNPHGNRGKRGFYPDSPSVDRIVPEHGYVSDNVRIISARANLLKSDATVEELEAVLADLRRLRCKT